MKEKIAGSEWPVMEVLWDESNLLAAEVIESLSDVEWSDKTVKTLLNRLVKKGLIDYTKEGKSYRYFPLVKRESCIREESKAFVEKVFGGSGAAFLTNMIKNERLSHEEINELRKLLDEKDGQ